MKKDKEDIVVIWGKGKACYKLIPYFDCVEYIVDSSVQKGEEKTFGGLKRVLSPLVLEKERRRVIVAISTYAYYEEIAKMAKTINPSIETVFAAEFFLDKAAFYGEYGEDAIVCALFRKQNRVMRNYIEIGVPNPIDGSNTIHFYNNGVRGICVEANVEAIDMIKRVRGEDKIICCGCGGFDEEGKELVFSIIEKNAGLNTFSETSLAKLLQSGYECEKKVKVQMKSLNTIIEECGLDEVDYVSVDVEGYEYNILKDFDFAKYKCKVFCIEKGNKEVLELMRRNHYIVVAETPANWIFVSKNWEKEFGIILS